MMARVRVGRHEPTVLPRLRQWQLPDGKLSRKSPEVIAYCVWDALRKESEVELRKEAQRLSAILTTPAGMNASARFGRQRRRRLH
jgi:hypothetical protein